MSSKKTKVVGSMSEWSGLLKDFFRQINDGSITIGMTRDFLEHSNPFPFGFALPYFNLVQDWQNFWRKITGKDYDFSNIRIPAKPEGKWRLLIIVDILLETLYAQCQKRFQCWRWTNNNLDEVVVHNERSAKTGSYAIWVKDEVEADENLRNLSANDIKSENLTTETLAERLIHELKFFDETGNHLDIINWTLCAGSRDSEGGPHVHWYPFCDEMRIFWCLPDRRDGYLRARQAVS